MADLASLLLLLSNTSKPVHEHPTWDVTMIYSRQNPEDRCGSHHLLRPPERLGYPEKQVPWGFVNCTLANGSVGCRSDSDFV